jgi:hypothetical protein
VAIALIRVNTDVSRSASVTGRQAEQPPTIR